MKRFPALIQATLLLLIILSLGAVTAASSQTAVAKVVVTSINVNDAFPEVRVQAKAVDVNGEFIPGIAASQFSIREDGEPVEIKVDTESLPLNLRVAFVIDEFQIAEEHVAAVREVIQSFVKNQ